MKNYSNCFHLTDIMHEDNMGKQLFDFIDISDK